MAVQLEVVSYKATVNGTQTGTTRLLYVDIDADLGSGEVSGYGNFSVAFELDGLSAGDLVGMDWGTAIEPNNTFAANTCSIELRPK